MRTARLPTLSHVQGRHGYPPTPDTPTPWTYPPLRIRHGHTPQKGPGTRDTHPPQKGHRTRDTHPPIPDRLTDICENITFP